MAIFAVSNNMFMLQTLGQKTFQWRSKRFRALKNSGYPLLPEAVSSDLQQTKNFTNQCNRSKPTKELKANLKIIEPKSLADIGQSDPTEFLDLKNKDMKVIHHRPDN